jgi:hypothetical protein
MSSTHRAAYDISDAYKWILYLNPEVHEREFRLVKNAGLDSFILVQDIRKASGMPDWLSVLPAVVNTKERIAWRGVSCFQKLVSIELPSEHIKRLSKKKNGLFAE